MKNVHALTVNNIVSSNSCAEAAMQTAHLILAWCLASFPLRPLPLMSLIRSLRPQTSAGCGSVGGGQRGHINFGGKRREDRQGEMKGILKQSPLRIQLLLQLFSRSLYRVGSVTF